MQPENSGMPPQQPAPEYGAPSQQPYSAPPTYATPPTSPVQPNRRMAVIIGAVVLVALVGLGIYHYTGPSRTVQGYINDLFVTYDANGAYSSLCSDVQAKNTLSGYQTIINSLKTPGTSYDTSGITYTVTDESFFGVAHVTLGGVVKRTANGQTTSQTVSGSGTKFEVRSSGLGWCLTNSGFNS